MKNTSGKLRRVGTSIVCFTTHPDFPNYDGRARGRVLHLTEPDVDRYAFPASRCGQLAVEYVIKSGIASTRAICQQCSRMEVLEGETDP